MNALCARKIRRLQATSATWLVRANRKLCVKSSEEATEASSTPVSVVSTTDKVDTDGALCILSTTGTKRKKHKICPSLKLCLGLVLYEPTLSFCEWRDYASGLPTSEMNPFFRIRKKKKRQRVLIVLLQSYGYSLIFTLFSS